MWEFKVSNLLIMSHSFMYSTSFIIRKWMINYFHWCVQN